MTSSSLDIPQQPDRPRQCFKREFIPLRGPYGRKYDDDALVQLSKLCVKCKEVVEKRLEEVWEHEDEGPVDIEEDIEHYTTTSLLRESYKRGCHLCSFFWATLKKERQVTETNRATEKKYVMLDNDKTWADKKDWQVTIHMIRSMEGTACITMVASARLCPPERHNCGQYPSDCYRGTKKPIIAYRLETSPVLEPRTTLSPVSTKDAVCGTFYKRCKDICDQTHKRCHRKRAGQLPTRLLRITEAPSGTGTGVTYCVRLISTRDEGLELPEDTKYAALSYCWGKQAAEAAEDDLQLKKGNYQSRLSADMPIEQLSATIQDAVSVTADLNLQFLWVDALCIKQNSREDWKHEAATMCDVYRYCSVAIAASGASDSREGLFAVRDPLQQAPCILPGTMIAYLDPWGHKGPWHLETRGWVVQEHLLPARSIKFGSYVSWECMELSVDEFGETQKRNWYDDPSPEEVSLLLLEPECTDPVDFLEVRFLWDRILSRYMSAELSDEKDRLAAIEGLSSAFQRRTGWKWVSGLWEPFILEELLWKQGSDGESGFTGLRPSWTWASIRSPISSTLADFSKSRTMVAKYLGMSTPAREQLRSSSPAVIKLSGTLWKILERHDEDLCVEGWPGEVEVRVSWDHKDRPWTDGKMLLPIASRWGLVVVPSIESTAFERIGCFEIDRSAGGVEPLMEVLNGSGGGPPVRQTILLE